VIDVYEYYWAPVITGRVSAFQSLKFLMFAALSPFQYLRDNLIVIKRAEKDAGGKKKLFWVAGSFMRELFRMFFISIPAMAISLAFYWLLATPISKITFNNQVEEYGEFFTGHLSKWEALHLTTFSIRVLLVVMCVIFLLQENTALMERKAVKNKGGAVPEPSPPGYVVFILALLGILIFVPYWLQTPVRAFHPFFDLRSRFFVEILNHFC